VSSQERITTILLRLLRGDQLNKQALMTEFNKDESSIRRDISVIKRAFDDVFSEPAPFIAASSGDYRLKPDLHAAGRSLDDGQLLAIALILTASRGLSSVEMKQLMAQLLPAGPEHKGLDRLTKNPVFEYRGVPKISLTNRLARLSQAIVNHELISFDHVYHGEMRHFDRRLPTGLFFGDLFFYLIVDGSDEQADDDPDEGKFVRFRLDYMRNITYHRQQPTHDHDERFRGGRLQNHTWYPYLGKPINLEILYSYDPQFVLDRFPEAIVDWKNVRDRPFIKNPYARKVYHITIPVNDGFGVRMWLQGQGDLVKVLAPKHIHDYVVWVLRKSLKNYQNEDDTGKYL
jgi:predicted DNA-binding transcriptional regulator YafY